MNIVVLTGAGISQESGLPTFRGAGGWWQGHSAQQLATPQAFAANPDLVWEFYNFRRRQLLSEAVAPNPAHRALAQFQAQLSAAHQLTLVTQNVDDLLERGGCEQVIHIHGELLKARCLDSGRVYEWRSDLNAETLHPESHRPAGRLRPHIVWFGEQPLELPVVYRALQGCDLFVSIGTSGAVWPAAGFVGEVPGRCRCVEINLEDGKTSWRFAERLRGPASQTVPEFFQRLLSELNSPPTGE